MGNGFQIAEQPATTERLKKFLLGSRRDDIERSLPGRVNPDVFIQTVLTASTRQPKLQKCTTGSMLIAVLEAGRLGLIPDGRQAALVPYWNSDLERYEAEFQPMVQGIANLISRSPKVEGAPDVDVVRDPDKFRYWRDEDGPHIEHIPSLEGDREDMAVTHAYSVVRFTEGRPSIEVMDRSEIEQARGQSKAPNSPAWSNFYGEMAKKTVLKRHGKRLDIDPAAVAAIEKDHAVETGEGPRRLADIDPRFSLEDIEDMVARQTEEATADLKRRVQEAGNGGGSGDGPEHVGGMAEAAASAAGAATEDAPSPDEEMSEEERQKAEDARHRNYRAWLGQMVEADDAPVDRQHVLDAAEELFGDREDVERNDAGFVEIEALDVDDLAELVSRVADERGLSEPGEGEDDG